MKLLDSNILILSATVEHKYLRDLFIDPYCFVSEISVLEVLGYHKLTEIDKRYFEAVFAVLDRVPVTTSIVARAINLRQKRKLSLGDSIIAASCLGLGLELFTHNVKDFSWIEEVAVIDPVLEVKE